MSAVDLARHAMDVAAAVVFPAAGLSACAIIVATVAPKWRRIVRLAAGHIEPAFAPEPRDAASPVFAVRYPLRHGAEAAAAPTAQVI
jgi:hypothetical protein